MKIIPFEDFIRRYFSGESFVVLDTETTGLNTFHDDIIEVAGIIWGKYEEPHSFQELMRVNTAKITPGAWAVHQIPKESIESARPPADVLADFQQFCGARSIIAHNARFDFEFLNSNLLRNGLGHYANDEVVCTLSYAKEQQMPGKLKNLAKHYNVSLKSGNLHRALYDVQVLTQVLGKMVAEHEPAEMQYSLVF